MLRRRESSALVAAAMVVAVGAALFMRSPAPDVSWVDADDTTTLEPAVTSDPESTVPPFTTVVVQRSEETVPVSVELRPSTVIDGQSFDVRVTCPEPVDALEVWLYVPGEAGGNERHFSFASPRRSMTVTFAPDDGYRHGAAVYSAEVTCGGGIVDCGPVGTSCPYPADLIRYLTVLPVGSVLPSTIPTVE